MVRDNAKPDLFSPDKDRLSGFRLRSWGVIVGSSDSLIFFQFPLLTGIAAGGVRAGSLVTQAVHHRSLSI